MRHRQPAVMLQQRAQFLPILGAMAKAATQSQRLAYGEDFRQARRKTLLRRGAMLQRYAPELFPGSGERISSPVAQVTRASPGYDLQRPLPLPFAPNLPFANRDADPFGPPPPLE